MLVINAKSNSKVDVLSGDFPVGDRNTLKVIFEDPIIQHFIDTSHTNTCADENNLYSYGKFDDTSYIKFITKGEDVDATIVGGYGTDLSKCLKIGVDGTLGECKLSADKGMIEKGKSYIFSCMALADPNVSFAKLNCAAINQSIQLLSIGTWQNYFIKFTAEEDLTFDCIVEASGKGNVLLDNIQLFLASDEIIQNTFDMLEVELELINPCQVMPPINEVINFSSPDSEEKYALLYFPPITVLDIQDNILCRLVVRLIYQEKDQYLGNTAYYRPKQTIYESDPFILTGYIVPPDANKYELTVGKI